jgi:hypothetical protein
MARRKKPKLLAPGVNELKTEALVCYLQRCLDLGKNAEAERIKAAIRLNNRGRFTGAIEYLTACDIALQHGWFKPTREQAIRPSRHEPHPQNAPKPKGCECPICHGQYEPLHFTEHLEKSHPAAHPVRLQHSPLLRKQRYTWGTGKVQYAQHEIDYLGEREEGHWKRDEEGLTAILRLSKTKRH